MCIRDRWGRQTGVTQGVPKSRGLGQVGARRTARHSVDTDGLNPGFRPGGENPQDVTEEDRIEDRSGSLSMRTGLKTPALQSSKYAGAASRVVEKMLKWAAGCRAAQIESRPSACSDREDFRSKLALSQ